MTPLLTTPKEFENAALFLRLGLSVTKTEVFENLLQTGGIENAALFRRFGLSVTKTEVIENLLQTGGIENAALFRRLGLSVTKTVLFEKRSSHRRYLKTAGSLRFSMDRKHFEFEAF